MAVKEKLPTLKQLSLRTIFWGLILSGFLLLWGQYFSALIFWRALSNAVDFSPTASHLFWIILPSFWIVTVLHPVILFLVYLITGVFVSVFSKSLRVFNALIIAFISVFPSIFVVPYSRPYNLIIPFLGCAAGAFFGFKPKNKNLPQY